MSSPSIDAIGPTSDFTSTPPATSALPTDGLDREAFLKLLVAQLKYQDPTKPADTSQMLAQTAQLTMVDRLNEMAASFQESATAQRLSLAGTMVGKDITFLDSDGVPVTARVDSARVADGSLVLSAGPYDVPYDAITSVEAPVQPAAATGLFEPQPPAPTTTPPTTTPPPITTTPESTTSESTTSESTTPVGLEQPTPVAS
jgi:flagellar basal-body rod modification protein FlgD